MHVVKVNIFAKFDQIPSFHSQDIEWKRKPRSEQFYLFLIYKSPQCFLPSFESIGLLVQEKKRKIDFQDGHHGSLGFRIGTILAIFDLQVILMLPTKFRVNWPFGSGEAKKRFSRWLNGGHLDFRSE